MSYDTDKVDQLEVIDESGTVYAKGTAYGTPVQVEVYLEDDGKTLKVFVADKATTGGE